MGEIINLADGHFPEAYTNGSHFALIGATQGGKSYYAKWLTLRLSNFAREEGEDPLPIHVFSGPSGAYQWERPEPEGRSVTTPDRVYTEWTKEKFDEIQHEAGEKGGAIILFDDFLGQINYHHNEVFKNLFRTIRHLNVVLIVVAHNATDIPPVVRANIGHTVIAYTNNGNLIEQLSKDYLGRGEMHRLESALKGLQGGYSMVVVSKANGGGPPTITTHRAGPLFTDRISLPPGAHVDIGGHTFGGVQAQARGDVTVGGHYNDHSRNAQYLEVRNDVRIQQENHISTVQTQMITNRMQMTMDRERVKHTADLARLRNREEVLDLLSQSYHTPDELMKISGVIRGGLQGEPVTELNVFTRGYDVAWMRKYYPDVPYTGRSLSETRLNTGIGMAQSLVSGDYVGGAVTGLRMLITGGVKDLIAPPSTPRATDSHSSRKQLRGLVLEKLRLGKYKTHDECGELRALLSRMVRADISKTPIHRVCRDFLTRYYPHEREILECVHTMVKNRMCTSPNDRLRLSKAINKFVSMPISPNSPTFTIEVVGFFKWWFPETYKELTTKASRMITSAPVSPPTQ